MANKQKHKYRNQIVTVKVEEAYHVDNLKKRLSWLDDYSNVAMKTNVRWFLQVVRFFHFDCKKNASLHADPLSKRGKGMRSCEPKLAHHSRFLETQTMVKEKEIKMENESKEGWWIPAEELKRTCQDMPLCSLFCPLSLKWFSSYGQRVSMQATTMHDRLPNLSCDLME